MPGASLRGENAVGHMGLVGTSAAIPPISSPAASSAQDALRSEIQAELHGQRGASAARYARLAAAAAGSSSLRVHTHARLSVNAAEGSAGARGGAAAMNSANAAAAASATTAAATTGAVRPLRVDGVVRSAAGGAGLVGQMRRRRLGGSLALQALQHPEPVAEFPVERSPLPPLVQAEEEDARAGLDPASNPDSPRDEDEELVVRYDPGYSLPAGGMREAEVPSNNALGPSRRASAALAHEVGDLLGEGGVAPPPTGGPGEGAEGAGGAHGSGPASPRYGYEENWADEGRHAHANHVDHVPVHLPGPASEEAPMAPALDFSVGLQLRPVGGPPAGGPSFSGSTGSALADDDGEREIAVGMEENSEADGNAPPVSQGEAPFIVEAMESAVQADLRVQGGDGDDAHDEDAGDSEIAAMRAELQDSVDDLRRVDAATARTNGEDAGIGSDEDEDADEERNQAEMLHAHLLAQRRRMQLMETEWGAHGYTPRRLRGGAEPVSEADREELAHLHIHQSAYDNVLENLSMLQVDEINEGSEFTGAEAGAPRPVPAAETEVRTPALRGRTPPPVIPTSLVPVLPPPGSDPTLVMSRRSSVQFILPHDGGGGSGDHDDEGGMAELSHAEFGRNLARADRESRMSDSALMAEEAGPMPAPRMSHSVQGMRPLPVEALRAGTSGSDSGGLSPSRLSPSPEFFVRQFRRSAYGSTSQSPNPGLHGDWGNDGPNFAALGAHRVDPDFVTSVSEDTKLLLQDKAYMFNLLSSLPGVHPDDNRLVNTIAALRWETGL